MCQKTNISLIRQLWITKLRLFDFFNTSYIFRYSHTVSLLPSITIEQICFLLYSWEENYYQNTSLFPQFENLCVQSNASANHLELAKLIFTCCVTMLCLKFAINFLRTQKFLLLSGWNLISYKVGRRSETFCSNIVAVKSVSSIPVGVSTTVSLQVVLGSQLTVAQSPSSKSSVGVYSILPPFSCEIVTGFLC